MKRQSPTPLPVDSSDFLHSEPCPSCGSRDNLARYSDGHGYCFGCQYYEHGNAGSVLSTQRNTSLSSTNHDTQLITDGVYADLSARGISEETCKHFGYTKGKYKGRPCHIANYHNDAGVLVAQKLRYSDKTFTWLGDPKQVGLFGDHLWGKGKKLVITEGEIDALTMSQVQKNQWPVVSLNNGAGAAKKSLSKVLPYLSNFEEVILMFDNDPQGQKAAQECAEALGPNRCKIAALPLKDPNEMLKAGRGPELVKAMWDARPYQPEGIIAGSDLLDEVLSDEGSAESIPYPWATLNEKTHGLRTSELVTLTAGTGIGKSAIVREIAYHLGNTHQQNVGLIMLEESTKRTALGIMATHASKPLHLTKESPAVLRSLFADTLGTGRYFLIDHFGSTDFETLKNRIRYLVTGCECQWVVLDHLSIVVSGNAEGDERRNIDLIMTELRTLVQELNFGLLLVSHLKRPEGKGHENGAETSLSQLRGSAAIGQLSDMVLGIERNQQSPTPNLSTIRVLKNRFSGETGIGCYLMYESPTGRLWETSPEFAATDTTPVATPDNTQELKPGE